ncbi:MAG: glycosyltransferase [Bacteroidota bacterium]
MDVSIIIINYNTFELTCACIESVIEKTKGIDYEIILVDNASAETDPRNFLKKFPAIILIESEVNDGFAKGNNRGIMRTSGKYVLLLNSDTLLKNNAVAIAWEFLERNPEVAVVGSRLESPDGTHQCNCQRLPSVKYGFLELLRTQKFMPGQGGKLLFGYFFDHKTVVYPIGYGERFLCFPKKYWMNFLGKNCTMTISCMWKICNGAWSSESEDIK